MKQVVLNCIMILHCIQNYGYRRSNHLCRITVSTDQVIYVELRLAPNADQIIYAEFRLAPIKSFMQNYG